MVKIVNFALEGKIAASKFKSKCTKCPIKPSIPKIEVTATGASRKNHRLVCSGQQMSRNKTDP